MRIVVFVGSPIGVEEKEVVKIAKRLKKENVNVDVINFGETDQNQTLLEAFVNTMNGREGTGSHLVTVPPSPHLADALLSSPVIQGEDGSGSSNFGNSGGFDFGVDPNEDPELALALRVSMEEQHQRQQEEERRTAQESASTEKPATGAPTPVITTSSSAAPTTTTTTTPSETTPSAGSPAKPAPSPASTTPTVEKQGASEAGASEEEMLQQALAMSLETGESGGLRATPKETPVTPAAAGGFPDFSTMTEEEQIAYAMQISLQGCQSEGKEEPMDVDEPASTKPKSKEKKAEPDFSQVMSDPAFLQDVLQSLPGVDPDSKVVRQAVGSLTGQDKEKDKSKEKEGAKEKKKKEDK